MRIAEVVWTAWNAAHITGHGGSIELAEAVLDKPDRVAPTAYRVAKAWAVIHREWTVVFNFEPMSGDDVRAYPITMYPTKRGGKNRRKQP